MTLTQNQAAAMTALIKSCLGEIDGKTLADLQYDPFTWVNTEDLVDAGWGRKEAEGTFGSLVAADLIYEADDNMFALTSDWAELRKYHA